MQSLLSDLRYATRELRKRPGFTLTAVLSLALGIGATSAVFSVIYAVLIDPFPYPGSDRIVELRLVDKSGEDRFAGLSGPQMDQLRQTKSLEDITAMDWWNLTTTDGDLPEDVQAMYISPNAPNHWGIRALMGRWLIPSDAPPGEPAQPVVVLTYQFWQRYFVGDPNVVGRTIQLVHKPYQIVGVMPPRFKWGAADMYIPQKVTQDPNIRYAASLKIRPGVSPEQASAELLPIIEQFAKAEPTQYPETFKVKLRSIVEVYARPLGPTLYLLLGAVASLLVIGCANVSILLLARGTERQHELAVRAAVGAGRLRMIRQLLTESLGIATTGAALGILFAWGGLSLLAARLPENSFPAESVIKMNVPVLLFSVSLAFATAIVFGLWPALQLSRPEIARLMQTSSRRVAGSVTARRSHGAMVAAQVALTLLMLTAAGAAGKGFLRLVHADLGYDPHNAMSVPIPIHQNTHVAWKDRAEYFEQIRAKLAAMPQVVAAGISTNATPPSSGWRQNIEIMGSTASEKPEVRVNFVSPEYFPLLRIPVAQGRLWDHAETMRGATLAVINQTMARQFWPNGDAIGHQIKMPVLKDQPPYQRTVAGSDGWMQIIGVVADARDDGLRNPVKPGVYIPFTANMWMFTQILVRWGLHTFHRQHVDVYTNPRAHAGSAAVSLARHSRADCTDRPGATDHACARPRRMDYRSAGVRAAAASSHAICDFLNFGAGAGRGWPVQRGFLWSGDAHQRIRHSHGPRRKGLRRISDCPIFYGSKRWRGIGRRHSLEHCLRQASHQMGDREFPRPADPGWRDALAHHRSGVGLHGSGTKSRRNRPHASITL